jgi:hypothetical protein
MDLTVTINIMKMKYPHRDEYVDAVEAFNACP